MNQARQISQFCRIARASTISARLRPENVISKRRILQSRNCSTKGENAKPAAPDAAKETAASSAMRSASALRSAAGHNLHEFSQMYMDLEKTVMERLHARNQGRFRAILATTTIVVAWVIAVWGNRIREYFSKQTAAIAKETLENKSLQIQTQELAGAVVQTVLNDPEVLAKAAAFLRDASQTAETQAALLQLTVHVLNHPDTLQEVVKLTQEMAKILAKDPETIQQVATIFIQAMNDERAKKAMAQTVSALTQDPEVFTAVVNLSLKLMEQPSVQAALTNMLTASSHAVLDNDSVVAHSKAFVEDVMEDDSLQRTGGTALWNTVTYSVRPAMIKMIGFGLLCGTIAVVKIYTSA